VRPARRTVSPVERCQAEKAHQLARVVEAAHIADLGCEDYRDEEGGATHRLVGFDDRRHRPVRHDRDQLLLKAPQPGQGIRDRIDPVLKDDRLRRVVEFLIGQPASMRHCPVLAAVEDAPVPKQKRQQLLTLATKVLGRRLAAANQIAHRLMGSIGHPYRGQLAGAQQPGQSYASRRLVLTRSPGLFGISDGETTVHSCPSSRICRYSP
jgi:hypothetical protein